MVVGPGSGSITGSVVSLTLMTWAAVLVLPQSSVAVQVRVWAAGQVPVLTSSTNVRVTLASQLSVAVAWAKLGVAGHSIVVGPGSGSITGSVVSSTLMVCVAGLVLPQSWVAVQVRVSTTGQVPLLLSTNVRVTLASQLSVAVAWAKLGVAGHSMVVGPGSGSITGSVVSSTLMVCVAVLVLPQSSVAVQVRVWTTGQVPLLLSTNVRVTLASQLSVAVA